jgi:hypothetical protein
MTDNEPIILGLRHALSREEFARLRAQYRLGENPKTHRFAMEGPFPHTRRIAYESGAPMWPLGWVKVEPDA